MERISLYTGLVWIAAIGFCCAPARKSAEYYQENKAAINELRSYYDTLCRQQPFSAGFTDKSLRYYVMQINTDTLRTIYNTDERKEELWENVVRFHYDTVLLKKMAAKMKEVKCLWIGKSSYYLGELKENFTFISFKSALIDKPFVENKYFTLLFFDHKIEHTELEAKVKKGQLVPIDDVVYFTIGSKYR